uniref:NADH-ubiquinone oxidoreductase chain 2 n=1 Tax=Metacarcinus magister TaxID=29965 RepID=A0A7G7WQD7_METMG|nr:NADH dehydrogenase subunit 2 [Metacarcinus magister]QNH68764.1 NADH dehydrogenase subunit 2 [Metacarcinus magister]
MVFPLSYFFFFSTLLLGMLLAVSSSSWFGVWVGLELNLMSFIPLIANKMNPYFSEAALKYFLVQALASTLIVMSSALLLLFSTLSYYLILMALLMKLGAAPFHFWFPQIMEGLAWLQTIILMTIQKLAPMFLISYLMINSNLTSIVIFSSVLTALAGALGGLNMMKLRKIMAFSSINHMSWMLIAVSISDTIWLTYFSFYTLISISVVLLFQSAHLFSLHDITNLNLSNPLFMLTLPLSLLSLGGLPPFSGFLPKWMMIQMMLTKGLIVPLLFLLLSSLITLYFYLRLVTPFVLMTTPTLSFNMKTSTHVLHSPLLPFIFMFNLLGLMTPLPLIILTI